MRNLAPRSPSTRSRQQAGGTRLCGLARRLPARRLPARLLLACAVLSVILLSTPAGASYGPPGSPQPNPAFAIPLSGSFTTSTTTWATVVMGRNDGNFDLFWQLFSLDAATGRFSLVTPPGVADNGGLMVAPDAGGSGALVGFGASQGLRFSPLAYSSDEGRAWSPGGLPDALLGAPSVVAIGGRGDALALAGGADPAVLDERGSLTSWSVLTSRSRLSARPAGRDCTIGSLEAVALAPGGIPLVGTSCRQPDTPGVFVDSDRQWHLADIPVEARLAHDDFAVVRLQPSAALLAAVHRRSTSLVAVWETRSGHPWVMSAPLELRRAGDLLASGTGPGTEQFVLLASGGSLRAEVIAGPASAWHLLPQLPPRTATIAITPAGQIDALAVNVTKLTVWRLLPVTRSWRRIEAITVPIVFGSSG